MLEGGDFVADIYDIDDFWDLAPRTKKREEPSMRPFATKSAVVEVSDDTVAMGKSATDEVPLSAFAGERSYEEREYEPKNNPLIRRVRIRHFNDRYDFYDGFRKSALLYYEVRGSACDFVPFYSYMPQYTQMNDSQKAYYFYLRDEIRRGVYPKADYSYLYLFVYEILNLPEKIAPEDGIRLLCSVWRAYRKSLPRIDKFFSVWVEDYCFVHELPSAAELVSDFVFDILKECPLREFYFADIERACLDGVLTLVSVLSDYDWRTGRYATGESAKAYRAHMEGALSYVLSALLPKEIEKIRLSPIEKITRDAFPNSLCTHSVKCRLTVEFHPFSAMGALRERVSALVKYIENHLRRNLGIKSRLTVKDLPEEYRHLADAYFNTLFAKANEKTRESRVPEYEKNYDAPTGPLSLEGAGQIESASWETTLRLVEDTEDAPEPTDMQSAFPEQAELAFINEDPPALADDSGTNLNKNEKEIVQSLLNGNVSAAKALAKSLNLPLAFLVDAINEKAMEELSDIVIEDGEDGYRLIEDYREDVELWLMK